VNNDQNGSIHVYGIGTSRRKQVIYLYVLLFVASCAVALAIGGQIVADHHNAAADAVVPLDDWDDVSSSPSPVHSTVLLQEMVDPAFDVSSGDPGASPFEEDPVELSSTIDPVTTPSADGSS
jgi:hypothetical protein